MSDMYRIAILGCENSHADAFISLVREGRYPDVEIAGVFTEYPDAADRMMEKFGIENASSADAFLGSVDGVMVTARHGGKHLEYLRPYIEAGLPVFIDKPVTASVSDAEELAALIRAHGVRFSGGSSCIHASEIRELCNIRSSSDRIRGGNLRAPVSMKNDYGNVWFYSQHLVQMMQELFGYYPVSVRAAAREDAVVAVFRYPDFDVTASLLDGSYAYSAEIYTDSGAEYRTVAVDSSLYALEMEDYYRVLTGGESRFSLSDLTAPVYAIDALIRAVESGLEEPVGRLAEEL